MSDLVATYNNHSTKTEHKINVPLVANEPLTSSIISLQAKVNSYLTQILESENKTSVSSVQEDELEQEEKEEEDDDDDQDSSMKVDRPELKEEQVSKKQKTSP